jgi:hypothetical protein
MGNSQSDTPNSQPVPTNDPEESHFEDEINLVDYFRVVWKWKSLILLGSVSPALIVGLILFFWPRNYKVTYVYDVKDQSVYDFKDQSVYDVRGQSVYDVRDQNTYRVKDRGIYDVSNWNLNEKNYTILLNRFYSAENTSKILSKLQESGLTMYAKRINTAGLKNFVNFEVSPPYMDLSKVKETGPFRLQQIRELKAELLNMTVIARPKNDISKISSVIRDNLENVIPIYMVEEQLGSATRILRGEIANIEENSFDLELALKTKKAVSSKLKKIEPGTSDKSETNIALQFDISGKTEYLPVEYQIQAAESEAVRLEEQIVANKERYKYYKVLLTLNKKLSGGLRNKTTSYYTIQQFHSFLTDSAEGYEDRALKGYLNSHIRRIKNRISVSAPVSENPKISSIAKGTAKKSTIVFAIALMISVFAPFLLEGFKQNKMRNGK